MGKTLHLEDMAGLILTGFKLGGDKPGRGGATFVAQSSNFHPQLDQHVGALLCVNEKLEQCGRLWVDLQLGHLLHDLQPLNHKHTAPAHAVEEQSSEQDTLT